MQIVIDIDERYFEIIKASVEHGDDYKPFVLIANGKPLKTGHWIEHPHEAGENWEYSRYECSECSALGDYYTDFCPNCGARMEESEGKG